MKENSTPRGDSEVTRIEIDGKKALLAIAIVAVILGGVAIRLLPLADSPYPYILDGLIESRYADGIMATGHLMPEAGTIYSSSHTASTPAYDAFLAASALFTGSEPLFLIQSLVAPLAVLMLLGVYVLARKLTENPRVAAIAIMGVAAYGPFVIVTQASWKECFALSIIPFLMVSFLMRRDPRMRAISTLLLLLLPFVHHLIALMAILSIMVFSFARLMIGRKAGLSRPLEIIDVFVSVISLTFMILYYSFMQFDRLEYLTPDNGLYLFIGIAAMITLLSYYFAEKSLSAFVRRSIIGITIAALLLLLGMNLISPIGTIETNALWAISVPMAAAIGLAVIGIWGMTILTSTIGESKVFYFAFLSAPLALILHAFLRAQDLLSLDMITRTLDLLDIGLMVAVGVSITYVLKKRSRRFTLVAVSAVCMLILLTLPFALDSERYAGTRNDILPYEVDAVEWVVENAEGAIDSDSHFSHIGYLFDVDIGQTLVRRISGTISFEMGITMVGSWRWTDVGVKDLPYGWVVLDPVSFESRLDRSDVLYIGGPQGSQIVVFSS